MTAPSKRRKRDEWQARLMIRIAARSSRNRSWLDRLCRSIIDRATAVAPEKDFMRDAFIDEDEGFDPDELDRYQRGETG